MIITIDGPTASGKSTVASLIAQRLGYTYINSGLLFRALAYLTHNKVLSITDGHFVEKASEQFASKIVRYTYAKAQAQIWYEGKDITPLLKTAAIDQEASIIAQYPQVRSLLTEIVRSLAAQQNVTIDGRDCGTVMFPNASYKFYLTADLETRAARWQADQARKGTLYSREESMKIIDERDTRDSQREIAPLAIPQDAHVIDSTTLNLDEVVAACLRSISN